MNLFISFLKKPNSFIKLYATLFILISRMVEAQIPNQIICGNDLIEPLTNQNTIMPLSGLNSTYGGVHTPKGELRVLIIFAAFSNTASHNIGNWDGNKPMPNSFDNLDALFFSDDNQFPTTTSPGNKSISQFYYQMSHGQFKVTANVLKIPNTNPVARIEIDPTGLNSWSAANFRVMAKIKDLYDGQIDWSRYDKRTNRNRDRSDYYLSDNSNSDPDLEPDYVVILYKRGDEDGTLWRGSYHGYSIFDGFYMIDPDGPGPLPSSPNLTIKGTDGLDYSFTKNAGFTASKGAYFGHHLFIHELSHELFSNPHNFEENSVVGDRFFRCKGPSMMTYGQMFSSCNAWESWYLGWLDLQPNHDVKPSATTKTVTIRDFLSYNEAVRIEIPHTVGTSTGTQHLWIENRQRVNIFDEKSTFQMNGESPQQPIPDPPSGLYFYIEDMASSQSNSRANNLVWDKPNSIRLLHGSGNFDYTFINDALEPALWNNPVGNFSLQQVPNPISGANDVSAIPGNYQNWAKVNNVWVTSSADDEIGFHNDANSGYKRTTNTGKTINTHGIESFNMLKKNGQFTYGFYGAYDPNVPGSTSVAFNQVGQGAGLSYNPVIVPLQTYDSTPKKLSPIYLNGLSVKIVAKRPDTGGKGAGEEYDIEIRYNDTDINIDQRFTGEIIQRNVPNAPNDYDVNVKANKTLTINKSGTANRHTKTSFNDFVNPTTYTCEAGSYFHQEPHSAAIIDQGSTFTVKNGAKAQLEEGSRFTVKGNSTLALGPTSEFILKSGATLSLENTTLTIAANNNSLSLKNGRIEINTGARLILQNTILSDATASGQEIVVNNGGSLEIHNTTISNYRIVVKEGGTLITPELSVANVINNGKIEVESGGYICVHNDATINLQDVNNVVNLYSGSLKGINPTILPSLEPYYGPLSNYCNANFSATGNGSINTFTGIVYIQNEVLSTMQYIAGQKIFAGKAVTTSKPQGLVIVQSGANVTLKAEEEVILDHGFEVQAGADFKIEKR